MYDGIDDYLEVDYFVDNISRFFCIKHRNDVRLISSRESIHRALILMNKSLNDHTIENKFSESTARFLDKNVGFIVKRIVDLLRKNQLTDNDSIMLHSTIDSLILEIEEVYRVDNECARGIVSDYLKCA